MQNIIKIGTVELTPTEAIELHKANKYIVTYSHIYKLIDRAGKICGKIIHTSKGMTRRGRFYAMDSETIYNVFGLKV